jgi:hypothetical protein
VTASLVNSPAFWLSVYSTVVATAVALLTLYAEVFLRVKVATRPGFYGSDGGPAFYERADEFPKTGQQPAPVFAVVVSNRGRQQVSVSRVYQAQSFQPHRALAWASLPYIDLAPLGQNTSRQFIVEGERAPEKTKPRRFFVVDGVGIIHPLRERWRQRIENLLYRRALLWFRGRQADARRR